MKILKKPKILPGECRHCGTIVLLKWKDLRAFRSEKGKRTKRGRKDFAFCPLCNGLIFPEFKMEADDERNNM